eukprot:234038-Rhodomonas_salina.1
MLHPDGVPRASDGVQEVPQRAQQRHRSVHDFVGPLWALTLGTWGESLRKDRGYDGVHGVHVRSGVFLKRVRGGSRKRRGLGEDGGVDVQHAQ